MSPAIAGRGKAAAGSGAWPADSWVGPVLIIRLSSLGDVLLVTPVLRILAERRPDLALDLLTRERCAPLLRGQPGIRRILTVESDQAGDYALVLDLQGGAKGRRAARRFAPGARRVGYDRAALRRRLLVLLGRRIAAPSPVVVRYAQAVAGSAAASLDLVPRFTADPALAGRLTRQLGDRRPERGWVLLAPGASRPLKAVPAALAETLERCLLAAGWGTVRLEEAGAAGESARAELRLEDGAVPRGIFRGSLPAVAALLVGVTATVAADSAILHLATAVGTPAVGLFGPTVPELGFSPLGRSRVVGVDLACRPCHLHGPRVCWLGHRRCWREIDPHEVVRAVAELTAASGEDPRNG